MSVVEVQRELFAIFDEFFSRATGKTAKDFASLGNFSEAIRKDAKNIALRSVEAFHWGIPHLMQFYEKNKTTLFSSAEAQGGIKVVLGGGGPFRRTQLNAVRRLLLYADTVLIPDPVLALIEIERPEEKLIHARLLEATFFLLRLKPLVDTDFGYPPLIVFQSWERSLAVTDVHTRAGIDSLISSVFSAHIGQKFANSTEIALYAKTEGSQFLNAVEQAKLFVAPGGPIGEPLMAAISRYKAEVLEWRTREHLEALNRLSDAELVFHAIRERLEPQFHLIENATELKAQPLLAIEAQAHYFNLSASSSNKLLVENEIISPSTRATMATLAKHTFEWLGNAPIEALVEMRLKNENEQFRGELAKNTALLNGASLADLDRVASEVGVGIGALLNEHHQEARRMAETYKSKFTSIAGAAWLTVSTFVLPYLAPFIAAVAPLLLTQQYIETKLKEQHEKKNLANSLVGILAAAKSNDTSDSE